MLTPRHAPLLLLLWAVSGMIAVDPAFAVTGRLRHGAHER